MEGSRIRDGHDGGGFRDFLDDQPIHAGDLIDLWVAGRWLPGRYEMDYQHKVGFFHTRLFDPNGDEETVIRINRATMRFRWPPHELSNDLNERYTRLITKEMQLRQTLREVSGIANRTLNDEEEQTREPLRYTLMDIRELVAYALGYK